MIARVDDPVVDELRRVARVRDVLALRGLTPGRAGMLRCPLHDGDRTPSFHIHPNGMGYRCFGCQAHGDSFRLVVALGLAKDFREARDVLANRYGIAMTTTTFRKHRERRVIPPAPVVSEPPSRFDSKKRDELRANLAGCVPLEGTPGEPYIRDKREIDPAFAAANDVRFHPGWFGRHAVMFAGRDARGKINCAQGRRLHPNAKPKAITYGDGSPLGVYATAGALAPGALVAVCEGPINALSLATFGLPAIATLGTGWPVWLRRKLAFRTVVIATDYDAAGEAFAVKLRRELTQGTRLIRLTLPTMDSKADVNDVLRRDPGALAGVVTRILAENGPNAARGGVFGCADVSNHVQAPQTSPEPEERAGFAFLSGPDAGVSAIEREVDAYFGG